MIEDNWILILVDVCDKICVAMQNAWETSHVMWLVEYKSSGRQWARLWSMAISRQVGRLNTG